MKCKSISMPLSLWVSWDCFTSFTGLGQPRLCWWQEHKTVHMDKRQFHEVSGVQTTKSDMVHPWRLTWNIMMEVWKIIFLSFHGRFVGSMLIFQGVLLFFQKSGEKKPGMQCMEPWQSWGFQLPITSTGWPDFSHQQYDVSLKRWLVLWETFHRRNIELIYFRSQPGDWPLKSQWNKVLGKNVHPQVNRCLQNDKSFG